MSFRSVYIFGRRAISGTIQIGYWRAGTSTVINGRRGDLPKSFLRTYAGNSHTDGELHPSEFVIDTEFTEKKYETNTYTVESDGSKKLRDSEATSEIPVKPDGQTVSVESLEREPDADRYVAADAEDGIEYHLHDGEYTKTAAESAIDSTPWYLREASTHSKVTNVAPLPEIPADAPKEVEEILTYLAVDLGLTELSVVDLRDKNTTFGPNALMLLCTARSERHLMRAAEDFRVHLKRTYRVKSRIEGLIPKESIKVQERRIKKKISKYTGDISAYEQELRNGNMNSWVFVNSEVKDIQIHMVTREKRYELDLEGLWQFEIPKLEKRLARSMPANLVDEFNIAKQKAKKKAREYNRNDDIPREFLNLRPKETKEHMLFTHTPDEQPQPGFSAFPYYSSNFVRVSKNDDAKDANEQLP